MMRNAWAVDATHQRQSHYIAQWLPVTRGAVLRNRTEAHWPENGRPEAPPRIKRCQHRGCIFQHKSRVGETESCRQRSIIGTDFHLFRARKYGRHHCFKRESQAAILRHLFLIGEMDTGLGRRYLYITAQDGDAWSRCRYHRWQLQHAPVFQRKLRTCRLTGCKTLRSRRIGSSQLQLILLSMTRQLPRMEWNAVNLSSSHFVETASEERRLRIARIHGQLVDMSCLCITVQGDFVRCRKPPLLHQQRHGARRRVLERHLYFNLAGLRNMKVCPLRGASRILNVYLAYAGSFVVVQVDGVAATNHQGSLFPFRDFPLRSMRQVEGKTRPLVGIESPHTSQRTGRGEPETGGVYLAAIYLEAPKRRIGSSRQIHSFTLLVLEMKKEVVPVARRKNRRIANHPEQGMRLLQTFRLLRIDRRQAWQLT